MDFSVGQIVQTYYGVGVVVQLDNNEFYKVRLWRIPGKSLASGALAVLRPSALLGRLPAGPGMVTSMKQGNAQVLVHTYYAQENQFLVSILAKNDKKAKLFSEKLGEAPSIDGSGTGQEYQTVSCDDLRPAVSAKFYPLLESLMIRADQAAVATAQWLEKEETKRFIGQTAQTIQNQAGRLNEEGSGGIERLTKVVEEGAPQADKSIKEVLQMVKDEEITVLLKRCRDRLEQLVSSDIPKATREALEKTGIRLHTEVAASSFSEKIEVSRKAALESLNNLLLQTSLNEDDLQKVRQQVSEQFTLTFDSLANAAKSDQSLNVIFEVISEKTTEWQEATGRLMQTRSASLFLEGATRLRTRAAALLRRSDLQWAGEIGRKLTKAFTEGDAALARLKSVELGESLKSRLVAAIEVRSESLGGLDGIIAGALTTFKTKGGQSGDQLKNLLTNLQQNASTATSSAHETLISMLSQRSIFRDAALLHIEAVLCNLESQFGEHFTAEQLAAISRGEGGTATLFEPIAHKAMDEIDSLLTKAEDHVTDTSVLEVLKRVRKIVSGELSVAAVTDEIIRILNDEKIVRVSESFMQQSEQVLDVIEGVSTNKSINDAFVIAERVGITKERVIQEIEKFDVNRLLDEAGNVVSDEKARRRVLSSATDTALDFVLRILPSMPVPPFEGVKDGLIYHISNLSMEGFKVRKEDIRIQLAGMRATKKDKNGNVATAIDTSVDIDDAKGTSNHCLQRSSSWDSSESNSEFDFEQSNASVKASELLVIEVSQISAILDDAIWSFEQTYMPYLKGSGKANVRLSDGSIRLQFELRKRRKIETNAPLDESIWEPVLCLHDRSCSIDEVDLTIQGDSKLTWMLNKLANIFKGPLRDYVVRTIVRALTHRSGWILERMNDILAPYWGLILRTSQLVLDDLIEADDAVVVKSMMPKESSIFELVWRERLPLGMNLLMNDDSGYLKVVDFPRGSQARNVCERRNLNPDIFKGATILGVNGTEFDCDEREDLFEALRDPGRPKTVRFRLAISEDAERVRKFVEGPSIEARPESYTYRQFHSRTVEFVDRGELGVEFTKSLDNFGLVVTGFIEGDDGIVLAAERSGKIKVGDLLTHINGEVVAGASGDSISKAISLLETHGERRPLTLTFVESYLNREVIEKTKATKGVVPTAGGPHELSLIDQLVSGTRRVQLVKFENVSAAPEENGILIGDHLVFINGVPVGAGCRWLEEATRPSLEEVRSMLQNKAYYPIGLTFARPMKKDSRWTFGSVDFSDSEAETLCVAVDNPQNLGFVLTETDTGDLVVHDFEAVPGIFQNALAKYKDDFGRLHLSIEWLNGQVVPSYANKAIVINALKRSWNQDEKVEIWVCDDELKSWVHSLVA